MISRGSSRNCNDSDRLSPTAAPNLCLHKDSSWLVMWMAKFSKSDKKGAGVTWQYKLEAARERKKRNNDNGG